MPQPQAIKKSPMQHVTQTEVHILPRICLWTSMWYRSLQMYIMHLQSGRICAPTWRSILLYPCPGNQSHSIQKERYWGISEEICKNGTHEWPLVTSLLMQVGQSLIGPWLLCRTLQTLLYSNPSLSGCINLSERGNPKEEKLQVQGCSKCWGIYPALIPIWLTKDLKQYQMFTFVGDQSHRNLSDLGQ